MTTAANETTTRRNVSICATFDGNRFDLPEGRDWLVTSEESHAYVVTVWVEEDLGRMASCRCDGFKFGRCCRHVKYVQVVDSLLTKAPVREIKPVYAR
jgi:hypothetical protein